MEFVITDEIGEGESVSIGRSIERLHRQQTRDQAQKLAKEKTTKLNILCTWCNIQVPSFQWDAHVQSKIHLKKAPVSLTEEFCEKDLYVDESTNAYKTIMGSKRPLAGGEYVITASDTGETSCTLCNAKLKDALTILDHLRSQKHINAFITRHFPEIYRAIQRKAKSKDETGGMVVRYTEELIRDFGKKEPLVHQQDYYRKLPIERQKSIDERLISRANELKRQKLIKLHEIGAKRPGKAANNNNNNNTNIKKKKITKSTSKSPARTGNPAKRIKSPARRNQHAGRSSRRSRSPKRSNSPKKSRSRLGGHRHRSDTTDRDYWSRSPSHTGSKNYSLREPSQSVSGRYSPSFMNSSPKASGDIPIDDLAELPTESDLFKILCCCELIRYSTNEKAYIQDIIESMNCENLLGVDFVVEYSDPKGAYEPGYLCCLCQCRLNSAQAVKHVVGEQHAMTYLKQFYKKQFTALRIGTLGDEIRSQMKNRYLNEISKSENRTKITHKIDLRPEHRLVFRHHKRITPTSSTTVEPSSDQVQKIDEMAVLEREMEPDCERNLEEGWYSLRQKSCDYFRSFAAEDALFYSIRSPQSVSTNFYGDWNPQVMRRLQDKFNFTLKQVETLQNLLIKWRVPMYAALTMADLRPLEQEVEPLVLQELVDQLMKPLSPLRYMQVFQYEIYNDDQMLDAGKSPLKVHPNNAQDVELLAVIDQLLQEARTRREEGRMMNSILSLLTKFRDCRAILFSLATKQPQQLNQLITLAKNPQVTVPDELLTLLRERLHNVADECRQEEEQRALLEENERARLELERTRTLDSHRQKLLRSLVDQEENDPYQPAVTARVQSFTPRIPGSNRR